MIARLCGKLIDKQPPELLVDVGGVGYEVLAPMSTVYSLPAIGDPVTLLTHFHVREDAQVLYGFLTTAERSLFRSLIKVNGIGAKMALAVLSSMSPGEFTLCVQNGDVSALTRVPGIGKKTAERLVVEMRDKLSDLGAMPTAAGSSTAGAPAAPGDPAAEARQALEALGYKAQDAAKMIKKVAGADHSAEELIRLALKGTL
ncbi:MAG: Holliday junction branch migration protein RuvA [Thiotrichales bacterium]